jgi:hypothetical protein
MLNIWLFGFKFDINLLIMFNTVNVGDDCPVFEGLFEYCGLSAGGSMGTTEIFAKIINLFCVC